jgi:hypothetical protein
VVGFSTSEITTTSGGPYLVQTAAFIAGSVASRHGTETSLTWPTPSRASVTRILQSHLAGCVRVPGQVEAMNLLIAAATSAGCSSATQCPLSAMMLVATYRLPASPRPAATSGNTVA